MNAEDILPCLTTNELNAAVMCPSGVLNLRKPMISTTRPWMPAAVIAAGSRFLRCRGRWLSAVNLSKERVKRKFRGGRSADAANSDLGPGLQFRF
jgi:hypothetical protein